MTPPLYATPTASASDFAHVSQITPREARRLSPLPGPVGAAVARHAITRRRYSGRGRAPGVSALIGELDRLAPDADTTRRGVAEYGRLTGTPVRMAADHWHTKVAAAIAGEPGEDRR